MRFVEFLRVTVLLSASAASMLAVLTLVAATRDEDERLVIYATAWWLVAAIAGTYVGRRNDVNPPIARLIADARPASMMPEIRPGTTMINRLWPLVVGVVVAGALAFVGPQIPAIAVGFTIIWALAWRRQGSAVAAIEERDGVSFFVDHTSPVHPIRLVTMPGFRRERPSLNGHSGA
jgi:hypothetical protein